MRSRGGRNRPVDRERESAWRRASTRLPPRQQRQLEPLPEAVDVVVADLAQPAELGLQVEQDVRGVLFLRRDPEGIEEARVQGRRRRGNVLQVAEDATGDEPVEDLG